MKKRLIAFLYPYALRLVTAAIRQDHELRDYWQTNVALEAYLQGLKPTAANRVGYQFMHMMFGVADWDTEVHGDYYERG